jgi:Sulfatase
VRLWLQTFLRLASGTYFVLTSVYCLLAFLPYTFCALIKAPPYPWMPWFVRHQGGLYWVAISAVLIASWQPRKKNNDKPVALGLSVLAISGAYVTLRPFLPDLKSDSAAYGWSLAALGMQTALVLWQLFPGRSSGYDSPDKIDQNGPAEGSGLRPFRLSTALFVALVASLVYSAAAGIRLFFHNEASTSTFQLSAVALTAWSLISHFTVAVTILSALNLMILIAGKTRKPRLVLRILLGSLIALGLVIVLARFLDSAMSFDGLRAYFYSAALAVSLTLWGFSLVLPFFAQGCSAAASASAEARPSRRQTVIIWAVIVAISALALESHSLIGGEDWNGLVESTFALIFWIAIVRCLHRLHPCRANYSAAVVLGIPLICAFVYKSLQLTEIFWGKSLGATDDEISRKFEEYGARDPSFQLAHRLLGNGRDQMCGDLCRILREHTNIRDNYVSGSVQLVANLTATSGHPNIFLFVIDSMRPDYLGAYDPRRVNYTPNLDALAQDSVVFRNVYTQYAGTSLSEPAIWSGALLLHTHFPQPFARVNSLETLARADGYQIVVSYDTVLQQLFPAADDLVKLDSDKNLWNQYEACSTVEQLESALDARVDKSRPVLFYAQPMNVHQFARNNVPSPRSQHWQSPAGLNPRITYEVHWVDACLGQFFSYLKQRGMYDNSIIVIASDHGDATGEFGRTSHSTSIWPEIMRVPLIIHVPSKIRVVYEENRLSTLTDIAPTLYYLLGHRPIRENPLYGRPLFAESKQELDSYRRNDLLLASDVRAVYGILTADGRYLYVTYDSPAESYLFDLLQDPNAEHSILTPALKRHYDEEIIEQLHLIADYYGYKPGVGSLLASATH